MVWTSGADPVCARVCVALNLRTHLSSGASSVAISSARHKRGRLPAGRARGHLNAAGRRSCLQTASARACTKRRTSRIQCRRSTYGNRRRVRSSLGQPRMAQFQITARARHSVSRRKARKPMPCQSACSPKPTACLPPLAPADRPASIAVYQHQHHSLHSSITTYSAVPGLPEGIDSIFKCLGIGMNDARGMSAETSHHPATCLNSSRYSSGTSTQAGHPLNQPSKHSSPPPPFQTSLVK